MNKQKIHLHFRLLIGSLVLLQMTAGCGTARRVLPSEILPAPSVNIVKGEQIFFQHCHQCHPGGQAGVGPALNNKPLPGWMIKFQVRQGLGAMPNFSEDTISSDELTLLISFLMTLKQGPLSVASGSNG